MWLMIMMDAERERRGVSGGSEAEIKDVPAAAAAAAAMGRLAEPDVSLTTLSREAPPRG